MAHNPPVGSKRQHHDDAEFNNCKADNLCFEWNEASRLRLDLERVNTENDNLKQSNAEKDVRLKGTLSPNKNF